MRETETPAPSRNLLGAAFDTLVTGSGAYATLVSVQRLSRYLLHGTVGASVSSLTLTVWWLAVGVLAVCLGVPALQRNLRRVPRDASGHPLARERGE